MKQNTVFNHVTSRYIKHKLTICLEKFLKIFEKQKLENSLLRKEGGRRRKDVKEDKKVEEEKDKEEGEKRIRRDPSHASFSR